MAKGSPPILCVGAAHWDIIARAGGPVRLGDDVPGLIERRAGGVALNVALGLADLGCPVSLCSVVGRDEGANALLDHALSNGIDCRHVVRVAGAPPMAYVAIEDNDGDLTAAIADAAVLETHAEALVGQAQAGLDEVATVFLEANLPGNAIGTIAERARQRGVEIIANPVSPAKAGRLTGLLCGAAHQTIVANVAEASVLTGTVQGSAPDAARALLLSGAGTALVTDGARGAALATPDGLVLCAPPGAPTGASVTGAGDALIAGYLASPVRRMDPQAALASAMRAAADHLKRSA